MPPCLPPIRPTKPRLGCRLPPGTTSSSASQLGGPQPWDTTQRRWRSPWPRPGGPVSHVGGPVLQARGAMALMWPRPRSASRPGAAPGWRPALAPRWGGGPAAPGEARWMAARGGPYPGAVLARAGAPTRQGGATLDRRAPLVPPGPPVGQGPSGRRVRGPSARPGAGRTPRSAHAQGREPLWPRLGEGVQLSVSLVIFNEAKPQEDEMPSVHAQHEAL